MLSKDQLKQVEEQFLKQIVICDICGENLEKYRVFYAQEHMKKYPSHTSHRIINI